MRSLRSNFRHTSLALLNDEHGYDLVEFALGAALAGSVVIMAYFRGHLSDWTDTATSLITN